VDSKVVISIVGAAATIAAALIAALVRRDAKPSDRPAAPAGSASLQQSGSGFQAGGNITVGRDATLISHPERTEGVLEVTNVEFVRDAQFDVIVRNVGDTDAIIHQITIKKVEDPGSFVLPILEPTAQYRIPVDDIPVGQSKSLHVSHIVRARTGDRFLVALGTTHTYLLEVTLHYNNDRLVSFRHWAWEIPKDLTPVDTPFAPPN
jgi:ribosomal protein L27